MRQCNDQQSPRRAVLYFRKAGAHRATREPALRAYAAEHSLTIVGVYADEHGCGERPALAQLKQDIASATRSFDTILHFDATAWGRIMCADTAGLMTYLCRKHGVDVVYLHAPGEGPGSFAEVSMLTVASFSG